MAANKGFKKITNTLPRRHDAPTGTTELTRGRCRCTPANPDPSPPFSWRMRGFCQIALLSAPGTALLSLPSILQGGLFVIAMAATAARRVCFHCLFCLSAGVGHKVQIFTCWEEEWEIPIQLSGVHFSWTIFLPLRKTAEKFPKGAGRIRRANQE
jgi:hypothetical protein